MFINCIKLQKSTLVLKRTGVRDGGRRQSLPSELDLFFFVLFSFSLFPFFFFSFFLLLFLLLFFLPFCFPLFLLLLTERLLLAQLPTSSMLLNVVNLYSLVLSQWNEMPAIQLVIQYDMFILTNRKYLFVFFLVLKLALIHTPPRHAPLKAINLYQLILVWTATKWAFRVVLDLHLFPHFAH